MGKYGLLTAFKKYPVLILFLLLPFTLAGCGSTTAPIDGSSTGFFDHYFVYPFSLLIKKVAFLFQGNYGIAIILIPSLFDLC